MDRFFHCAENICKKRLIPLALICAMLISVAPPRAMAAKEKPAEQTADRTLVKNWGFESGDLRDWTVLTPGWGVNKQGGPTGVISARSSGACEMPTNQSGSYHLSGLHNGIPGAEGWAVRSSSFLLSGSGWISVKMGGEAAAVKVFLKDGTQVGYYRQNRFHDVNYPYLSQGGSWNDMATYVMDLSEYLGKEMYVVLCDEVMEGKSANALFDDVITYYDTVPDPTFRFDTVMDGHPELGSASEVQIPWVMGYNLFQPCTENEVKNGGFESGDLTGWTVLTEGFEASNAVISAQTYWEQELPYNQSGFYHLNGWNTGIPEEKGWAVRSSSFVLGGSGYISVKMGGNAAVTKVFLSDGTQIGDYRNFRFRDASFPYIAQGGAWCDMATYVIDLSDYLGKEMYLELHDEVIIGGWANAFFDDVVTYYETAPNVSGRCDKVPDGHQPGMAAKLAKIPWILVPKANTEAPRQVLNGDFETGDLTGWTVLGSGFPIKNGLPAANSDETYWEQELPYNKSGSYFVNGSALSSNEASTWRLRSAPFTLEGSGWISVKMGGHAAAVRVYRMDGTLVGDFDQSRFCDKEFPYLSKGGSWNDMATYLMDLTPNLGEVLYIELCDIPIKGSWANAFFDDVVTYYPVKPVAKSEWVADGHKPGERAGQVKIPTVIGINNLYNPRNSGFEMGNLTGWTVTDGKVNENTAVVAAKDYNLDDLNIPEWRKLPYNTSGNHLLSGHDAVGNDPEDEDETWTIRSSPFTLMGSGYISVKMGGRAAAFQVRTAEDNKIIGYCQQRRFNDVNFPYNKKGGSWRDMATYVMDLSDYLGQKLVIELMDVEVPRGWAQAYFDEIITYYPKRPTTWSDTVIGGYKEGIDKPENFRIPWIYLDDYYDDVVSRFPPSPSDLTPLKDISGEKNPGDFVDLYEYFTTNQGLSGYDLEASSLTFPGVKYYKMDGTHSWIGGDYRNLEINEGCYVVNYRFTQAEKTQTGKFSIVALPSEPTDRIFNGGFEIGTMAGWTPLTDGFNTGTAVISAETYWNERLPYNQAGSYHLDGWNTGIGESDPWSVRSTSFILGGSGYISWRMGGNAAALSVCKADGTEIARVSESRFSDTGYPNVSSGHWADMATYVMDLSEFMGNELYIVLHDEKIDGGWAHAFFDEIVTYHPEAPETGQKDTVWNSDGCEPEEVDIPWIFVKAPTSFQFDHQPEDMAFSPASVPGGDLSKVNLEDLLNGTTATCDGHQADIEIIEVKYEPLVKAAAYAMSKSGEVDYSQFDMSAPGVYQIIYRASYGGKTSVKMSFTIVVYKEDSIPNGGFEEGDLTGWTPLTPGFNADTAVISAETYWGEKLPYNQAGSYHLDGWNTGIAEGDGWAVRSSAFTLGGSGFISVRMGGHAAAVKVFKADGTLVGYYKQTRFNDANFPNVSLGSWADMGTYVMDLSDYIGEELYIELWDEADVSGWAHAFFDEVVTNYETVPDWENESDSVTNGAGASPATVDIPWQLAANLAGTEKPPEPVPENAQITNGGFETGDLTGWTHSFAADKTPVISDQTYWGDTRMPYNQAGSYHLDGFPEHTGINEPDGWTVRSGNFTLQGSGWISVRMGGHAAAVKVFKADGTPVGYYKQTRFNDTGHPNVSLGSWADMGTYVMDLSDCIGEELYIELCDEAGVSGWANAFFDEVVTYYATAPNYASKSDTVTNSTGQSPATVDIPWQLAANLAEASEPIPENAQITNGGFETGNLDGWTPLTPGFNADTAVISAETYWGEELPYNQAGNYHLDGWNTGIGEGDGWAVRSGTFTLGGSGYISVRMGGKAAAVKVYHADGTLVGYYKQTRFKDEGFPSVASGSWADMGTYAMDLSAYKGQELYIELCDEVVVGGWAHAFFDEVVTYYKDVPDWEHESDTVTNGTQGGAVVSPATVDILWQLAANQKDAVSATLATAQMNETAVMPNDASKGDDTYKVEPDVEVIPGVEGDDAYKVESDVEVILGVKVKLDSEGKPDVEVMPDPEEKSGLGDAEEPKKPEELGAVSEDEAMDDEQK